MGCHNDELRDCNGLDESDGEHISIGRLNGLGKYQQT